jgi:hypothetical protein
VSWSDTSSFYVLRGFPTATTSLETKNIDIYPTITSANQAVYFRNLGTSNKVIIELFDVNGTLLERQQISTSLGSASNVIFQHPPKGLGVIRIVDEKGNIIRNEKHIFEH